MIFGQTIRAATYSGKHGTVQAGLIGLITVAHSLATPTPCSMAMTCMYLPALQATVPSGRNTGAIAARIGTVGASSAAPGWAVIRLHTNTAPLNSAYLRPAATPTRTRTRTTVLAGVASPRCNPPTPITSCPLHGPV